MFELSTPMREIEARFPYTKSVLHEKFHVGGCSSCGYEPQESLAQVAAKHGKDAVAMRDALNAGAAEMNTAEMLPEQLRKALECPESVAILDVREDWEFDICHLPQSVRLTEANFVASVEAAAQKANVVVVCHHGIRSMNAALYLRANGLPHARSLKGGLDAWSVQVDPHFPRY